MQIRRTTNVQNTKPVNFQTDNKTNATSSTSAAPVDQLDISAEAQFISQSGPTDGIRMDRVNDIRAQIANGQYETAEKLDAAVSRLLDEIG